MRPLQRYVAVAVVAFLAGMAAMYSAVSGSSSSTLPPSVVSAPTHTVSAVVQAQDKSAARNAGAISKKTEKDPDKEVLQTGKMKDDSGTKHVAAVLDTPSGVTQLTVARPWMEWMGRHEVAIGYGLVDGDLARAAQYRLTFARVWNFYGTLQIEAFQVDRPSDRHPWNAVAYLNYRW